MSRDVMQQVLDDIETKVAANQMTAAQVFTQMRQLFRTKLSKPAAVPDEPTLDNVDLARKILRHLGHAISESREPGADDRVDRVAAMLAAATQPPAPAVDVEAVRELDQYDAGLLNDYGGGNVDWWHDYIRSLLGSAHDFYQDQPAQSSVSKTRHLKTCSTS